MKQIRTEDAVGHVLCHDITQIVKGVTKDAAFRKGHIVTEEDIPVLLSLGKDHLYIWEKEPGMLHENEAAEILYSMCAGENMRPTPVKEGKIELIAECDGLFLVDVHRLQAVNALGEIMVATRHSHFPVQKGDKLAGTRVIPLTIREEKLQLAKVIAGEESLLALKPFVSKKVGLVTTGNEVYHGRIKDTFTPVIKEKIAEYDTELIGHIVMDDNHEKITAAINELLDKGAELILCTGGMSVDPDDKTPLAIKNTGAKVISYGAPVLPGAMLMVAYTETGVPIIGLPGCVMYAKRTVFDLVLPLVMANEPITLQDLAAMGHGGLCLSCPTCTFPQCGFDKGW